MFICTISITWLALFWCSCWGNVFLDGETFSSPLTMASILCHQQEPEMQAQADRAWQYKATLLFCGVTALWVNKDIAPPEKSSSARPGDTVCILHALNRLKFFNTSSRPANFNFAANPQTDNDLLLDCKGFISKENQKYIFRQREKPVPFTVQLVALYPPSRLWEISLTDMLVIEASCKHRDEQQEETKNLQAATAQVDFGIWASSINALIGHLLLHWHVRRRCLSCLWRHASACLQHPQALRRQDNTTQTSVRHSDL